MSEAKRVRSPLPPGSTIGILGSGQLGRMLAIAAARLGLRTHVLADAPGSAFDVATAATVADYADAEALATFAAGIDVVTYEFENVPLLTAGLLAGWVEVRPPAKALEVAQDRLNEKRFISGLGIPVAPFIAVDGVADLAAASATMAAAAILKTRRLGYDGKGQVSLHPGDDPAAAHAAIAGAPAVLERRLAFEREISILAVRGCDGALAYFDCPENTHREGILRASRVPARVAPAIEARARDIARVIAEALGYVGVLAVELFHLPAGPDDVTVGGRLVVNEIAPRVHNSGHWTMDACAVDQFEAHVRAVAGWPMPSTMRHSDAEMVNLIGADVHDWHRLAAEPNVCLHLYGKNEARPGRKMGHYNRLLGSRTEPTP